jgi:hypothetical protein
MKKTRLINFKIKPFEKIQFKSGSMDCNTYKSCFIEMKGYFESLTEDHKKNMFQLKKKVNGTIDRYVKNNFFHSRYISIEFVSESFVETGKSFTSFEFTLFPKRETNKEELTNTINELTELIYKENIESNTTMKFIPHYTKQ